MDDTAADGIRCHLRNEGLNGFLLTENESRSPRTRGISDQELNRNDRLHSNLGLSVTGQAPTPLDRAQLLISVHELRLRTTATPPFVRANSVSPNHEPPHGRVMTAKRKAKMFWKSSRVAPSNRIRKASTVVLQTPSPARRLFGTVIRRGLDQTNAPPIAMQYTREVRCILYMCEFVLLRNYVEVVIPLVFSIYLAIMYQLPNRDYYSQLAGVEQRELYHTLGNVLLYCTLQSLSLVAVVLMLKRKLGLSPIHQLAFVLEKQCVGVQIKLVFWVFYNVQASLQHYGFDYTFRFEWLYRTSLTSNATASK